MADDGGYSVWGAGDDGDFRAQLSIQNIPSISPPKRSSKLFDDLEETTADWDIQASPPPGREPGSSKRHSFLNEALPTTSLDTGISSLQAPEQLTFEPAASVEDDLVDRLDSAGFDDFDDGQFETAGDHIKDDDFGDFGDFGDFEEDQATAFDVEVPEASVAGPSRDWVSLNDCR